MRRCAGWLLGAVLLACAPAAHPQQDGGGRDLSVALFSTRSLRAVTVAAAGSDAWVATCARCVRRPLSATIHMTAPAEIFVGGTVRVTDDASHEERTATGLWHLRATHTGGEVNVVLTLPSERYVAYVLNAEAAADETRRIVAGAGDRRPNPMR